MSATFRFRVTAMDRLARDMIYLTGQLITGVIRPECIAQIAGTDMEILIKGVVLIHPPDRPADQITLMIERLPTGIFDLVGKDLIQKPSS